MGGGAVAGARRSLCAGILKLAESALGLIWGFLGIGTGTGSVFQFLEKNLWNLGTAHKRSENAISNSETSKDPSPIFYHGIKA